ncbi:MAG: serine hydrolase domain-containing protein [Stellaceae bacterium]
MSHANRGLDEGNPEQVGFSPERLARVRAHFQGEVEQGLIPGGTLLIARHGKIACFETFGHRDKAAKAAMGKDAIFRIFSMSKPITSVAAMALVEEGKLQLENPVAAYIPAFADAKVGIVRPAMMAGLPPVVDLMPVGRPPTVQDLLRHTSGLTYGFFDAPGAKMYRDADLFAGDFTTAEFAERVAKLPLAFQPGAGWNYSHASDVLGRVVEVASGTSLYQWERQQILDPLGMSDTSFFVADKAKHGRVAEPAPPDNVFAGMPLYDPRQPMKHELGGQGMQSTALDYARFLQMLLNGGAYEGKRVLSPETVAYMTSDHLGAEIGPGPTWYIPGPGYGFGLGFAVRRAAGEAVYAGSVGSFHWSGAAGTTFWCDPKRDFFVVWMMQAPMQLFRINSLLSNMVYAALVEQEK